MGQTWGSCVNTGAATLQCLEPIFAGAVQALVALLGVALFIMFVIGGYGFLFSGGDQKKLEKARGTLTAAIAGVVIVVVAYLILLTINKFTGVDITKFTIPTQ
jgi:NADH:ubiquinone oxidoreductase subunit 6 (subunit J)